MTNRFDRDYFENGARLGLSLYTDYRWLPELTIPMVESLIKNLGLKKEDTILDFGCAKGYVVKALRLLGYEAYGTDISEYAIASAEPKVKPFLFLGRRPLTFQSDWVLAKDVLEHLTPAELDQQLVEFNRTTKNLFIAVPLGTGEGYVIPEMEKDVTHKIRRPLWWWSDLVEAAGFKIVSATFTMPGIKENWTRKHPFGNGFIVAKA